MLRLNRFCISLDLYNLLKDALTSTNGIIKMMQFFALSKLYTKHHTNSRPHLFGLFLTLSRSLFSVQHPAVLVSCGHDITGHYSSPIGHLATLPGNSSERPASVCVSERLM